LQIVLREVPGGFPRSPRICYLCIYHNPSKEPNEASPGAGKSAENEIDAQSAESGWRPLN